MDLNYEFSKFIQIAEKKRFNQAFFFSLSWTNLQRQTFHFPIVEFPVGEMKASLLVYHWKISVRKIVLSKLLPKKLFCGKIYRKHKKKQIWKRERDFLFYFIYCKFNWFLHVSKFSLLLSMFFSTSMDVLYILK